jgi:hypothetical protein
VGYTSDEVMGHDFIEDFITPGFKASVGRCRLTLSNLC